MGGNEWIDIFFKFILKSIGATALVFLLGTAIDLLDCVGDVS